MRDTVVSSVSPTARDINIKTSSGEQPRHLAQYTGSVFHQYGIYFFHSISSTSSIYTENASFGHSPTRDFVLLVLLFHEIHRINQAFQKHRLVLLQKCPDRLLRALHGLLPHKPKAESRRKVFSKSGLPDKSTTNSYPCRCNAGIPVPCRDNLFFKTMIFTGTSNCRMVASSIMDIWKEPSPQTATTCRLLSASFAPIAAGMEYPMVPMPPVVKNRPFFTIW